MPIQAVVKGDSVNEIAMPEIHLSWVRGTKQFAGCLA